MAGLLTRALVLAALGLGSGVLLHWVRFGAPVASLGEHEVCEPSASIASEIAAPDANALCSQERVAVLDTRSAEDYARGHIPGAIHLPCTAGRLAETLYADLDAADAILVYGRATADARAVAESLAQRGYGDVRILRDGYEAWDRAGLACVSGACEHCAQPSLHEEHE